jgi:type II secretory pathway predicted ATPase ExeA
MYESLFRFFGLAENPFHVSPDPRYLYRSPSVQEALAQLGRGVESRQGFVLLTGEAGTGKTTVLREFLGYLRAQNTPVSFVYNSRLKLRDLLDFILADFAIPCASLNKADVLKALNQWLIERFRAGQTPVLIVDEAQGMPLHVLEEILLLLNLETPQKKLLQVVLCGTPELEAVLQLRGLRQLRQRISSQCRLAPLSAEETAGYIAQRLRIAGASRTDIFSAAAVAAVHADSGGVPRVVNLLCEHGLIEAYATGSSCVEAEIIREVAEEFQLEGRDGGSATSSATSAGLSAESAAASLERILEKAFSDIAMRIRPERASATSASEPILNPGVKDAAMECPPEAPPAKAAKIVTFPPPQAAAVHEFLEQMAHGGDTRNIVAEEIAPASPTRAFCIVSEHAIGIPATREGAEQLPSREWHSGRSRKASGRISIAARDVGERVSSSHAVQWMQAMTTETARSTRQFAAERANVTSRVAVESAGMARQFPGKLIRTVRNWMCAPVSHPHAADVPAQPMETEHSDRLRDRFLGPVVRWLRQPIRPF